MSEPITYWKWARDGMVVAACPEIQDDLYIIRERYDALQAMVRDLEEQLRVATAINHAFKQSEETLEAKLRKAEEERTCADEIHQRICEILDSEQWREGNRVLASWEVVQRIMQERDQLQARVGELEEALRTVSSVGRNILKPKFDHCGFMNATQLGNRDAVLHMLKQVERALEGKEEHGTKSND